MAKVFIVEDNQDQLDDLIMKTELLGHDVVGSSQRAIEALSEIEKKQPEIVLLDINLNGDNDGLVLGHHLKNICEAKIIFITSLSSEKIIQEAISLNPSGYLTKPISLDDLKINIRLALFKVELATIDLGVADQSKTNRYITIRVGHKLKIVYFDSIKLLKIETRNYVTLIDENDREYVVRSSMKTLLNLFNDKFVQVHRIYAINLSFFSHLDEKERSLYIRDRIAIPLGKVYRGQLYKKLNIM